jgi:phosphoglycolate phosphatase-like HAD superfamily hydrolase
VNLYSKTRGANRFPALVRAIKLLGARPQVRARKVSMPDIAGLEEWIARETKLGNATLNKEVAGGNKRLEHIKVWSDAVNAAVEDIVHGVPPFPLVRECLDRMIAKADLAVVSGTPGEALTREWEEHGMSHYPEIIAGQELGKKTDHLRVMTGGGKRYAPENMLMIGDAPGDYKAARAIGLLFYPINPGHEEDSWQRLHDEALDRFFAGTYKGDYEAARVAEFDKLLPSTPPWKTA